MAIKIKHKDPKYTEFGPNDIVLNIKEGTLFYKSEKNIFKLTGDNLDTKKDIIILDSQISASRGYFARPGIGDMTIAGETPFEVGNKALEVGGHILPKPTESPKYDLGSLDSPWRDIYFSPSSLHFVVQDKGVGFSKIGTTFKIDKYGFQSSKESSTFTKENIDDLKQGKSLSPTGRISASGDMRVDGTFKTRGEATFLSHVTASSNISASGTITAEHIESTDDMTVAGDLDVGGEVECDHLNIHDVDDGIHFGNTQVLHVDASNNVNFGVPSNAVVDLELYGHSHTYTAGGSITLDAGGDITLDAAGDQVYFKDAGTTKLTIDTSAGHITASGNISGSSNLSMHRQFDLPGANGTTQGDIIYIGSEGSTFASGKLHYLRSNGDWELADKDSDTTSDTLLGFALGSAVSNGILIRGMFRYGSDLGTLGDVLYVGDSGVPTNDISGFASGDIIRVIGYLLGSTNGELWFNPDGTFIEKS